VPETPGYFYDASSAAVIGRRERQEDSIAADFAEGASFGFVVLADGMGGHKAGDVASRLVVSRVFSQLKMLAADPETLEKNISGAMRRAAKMANDSVLAATRKHQAMQGMGATLVAPVVFENRLYWISIGDSPLYLLRGEQLYRLNEEHSVARQMDKMVAAGRMAPDVAAKHPDRACLTSALNGRSIPEIDCSVKPVRMYDGDIVIAASDGLQFIGEKEIARIIYRSRHLSSAEIRSRLVKSIADLDDTDQDNVAFCVFKFSQASWPGNSGSSPARASTATANIREAS
jgi:serine/threonine protein phosphatase PrpC